MDTDNHNDNTFDESQPAKESLNEKPVGLIQSPNQNTVDRTVRINWEKWLSIAALIISVISITLSYRTFDFGKQVREYDLEEHLKIELKPPTLHQNANIILPSGISDISKIDDIDSIKMVFIQLYWECILTNVGNRTLSVTDFEILDVSNGYEMFFSHLNGGLFLSPKVPINLPIVLETGESKNILLKIGLMIDGKTLSRIIEANPNLNDITLRDIHLSLAKTGADLFGNKVTQT